MCSSQNDLFITSHVQREIVLTSDMFGEHFKTILADEFPLSINWQICLSAPARFEWGTPYFMWSPSTPGKYLLNYLWANYGDLRHRCADVKQELLTQFCILLGHRLRRWLNIEPTLTQHLMFAYCTQCVSCQQALYQCCLNIGQASQTLAQH